MDRARTALACGVLVLLVGFGVGTERSLSVDTTGPSYFCGSAIPSWALVTGTRAPGTVGTVGTKQRAADDACRPVVRRARLEVAALMGLGAALSLAGWSSIQRRTVTDVRSSVPPVGRRRTHEAGAGRQQPDQPRGVPRHADEQDR